MIKDQIGKIIKERIRNCDELNDEWDYGLEQCRKDAVNIYENDLNKTISFFESDCSDEEFYWLSEIFEDIAEKLIVKNLSQHFADVFQRLNLKTIANRILNQSI